MKVSVVDSRGDIMKGSVVKVVNSGGGGGIMKGSVVDSRGT